MGSSKIDRRKALQQMSLGVGALSLGSTIVNTNQGAVLQTGSLLPSVNSLKGNINHSVCRWCYHDIPLQELATEVKTMGINAIDLLKPDEWKIVKDIGLECSLGTDTFASITKGFNNPKNHESLQKQYHTLISQASHAGIKQVIVFSGNRNTISDAAGLEYCAMGLDILVKHAEKNNVTIVMELLNSKVDHKDYQCDHTPWGVALVDKIGSNNFKLLYDIYHMQIMEGDIISTINTYKDYIAHYHTGGVPGRNEINNSQELNYPAVMRAIVATEYKGYVAQEFIPTYKNKLEALKEGITICDV
ncbi:hydroxypyruvate isomerase family protein [Aquimarina sp. 2201CG5-10]|uniref:hydroxypyruvate isomerase family protein n=1 Tax=Aquimarina callyspongiae TaxID=3098150 RepID=UPI002AB466A1|nr:TIM barrel protein [Aquimarina sp. 2201CG5-10]MDY8136094.1 TIM barrel protein [Aquimarina sp. 2201CG5-10]